MARIIDEGLTWRLDLHPEAVIQYDKLGNVDSKLMVDESVKGYRAVLGLHPVTEKYAIKSVWYDKDRYSIGDVLGLIDNMKSCARCDTLDKERLENISIETVSQNYNTQYDHTPKPAGLQEHTSLVPPVSHSVQRVNNGSPVVGPALPATTPPARRETAKEMLSNAIFNAYLTKAGQLALGNVFGDEEMVEAAYPKNLTEMSELVEQTTSGKFLRNPDEAKEFFSAINAPDADSTTPTGGTRVRKTRGIVIY